MAAGRTKWDSLARPVFPGPGLFIFQNFALLASSFLSVAVMSLRERTRLGLGIIEPSWPIEFVWTMWTISHKSPQQQKKQARIFSASFYTNWER
jgi:hypothetical protein